ncbi:helix-turn-helix domain-containing protein [Pseudactinotalea sp. HY160]|uniref:excisionase family DNA-binding protein n=1 Tax=Pseudactinotalea sp. HY160 TaxID=2654490 RepID=UPI00128E7353|nr:excisionase family DNA-binding protein [Pseudactinotalea sp. HY160]MPV50192.1 helix-turn-helix domain-containing protein [Pseudactinotalea sp. HY160]
MEMTTTEVAARLGVSVRQVQRLAQAGRLQVVRRVGSSNLLDDSALTTAAAARRGRTWAAHTAWAAVDLLETGRTERLTGSSLSRLRGRLRSCNAAELVRLTSRRAQLWRGSQTRRTTDQLRDEISLSGESMLARRDIAAQFGLVAVDGGRIEGYVAHDQWQRLQHRFGLEADAEGGVLIHCTDQEPTTGIVTAALDLAERWGVRERGAALELLAERLAR